MGENVQKNVLLADWRAYLYPLGYGTHLAWVAMLFYQGTFFDLAGRQGDYYRYYLASMVVLVAALTLFGLVLGRRGRDGLFSSGAAMLAFSGLSALGTLLAALPSPGGAGGTALFFASVALTGLGSAYINVAWGRILVAHLRTQAVTTLCLSYGFSALIYFVAARLPPMLALPLSVLMPLVSMAVARVTPVEGVAGESQAGVVDECDARDSLHFAVRVVVAAAVFGCVIGALKGFAGDAGDPPLSMHAHSSFFMLFLNLMLVVAVPYMESRRLQSPQPERFVVIYRISLLALVGALLVSGVLGFYNLALQAIMLAGYTAFKILAWSELCLICRAGSISPTRMFGLGEACMAASLFVSNLAMSRLAEVEVGFDAVRILIAVSVAVLLATYMFLLNERAVLAVNDLGKPKESENVRMRFQDRMEELSTSHGLTKREAEILKLFVRGRSSSRIAEDLYISSGTVATHLRNIYRKLGVHSRQELIDLLDNPAALRQGEAEGSA